MDLRTNWVFLGDFVQQGAGEFPFTLVAKAIRLNITGRTPTTWFRAGVIVRLIEGVGFRGRVEKRPVSLNTDTILVWEHDLEHSYRILFYPHPWLRGFWLTFTLYQLFEPPSAPPSRDYTNPPVPPLLGAGNPLFF